MVFHVPNIKEIKNSRATTTCRNVVEWP